MLENFGLILVLGIAHFLIGGFWYSQLAFAEIWMRGLGLTKADIQEGRVNIPASLLASALASLAQAAVLVMLIVALPTPSPLHGALIGTLIAAAFSFLPMLKDHVWADRPWTVILVDAGYEVSAAALIGGAAAWWLR